MARVPEEMVHRTSEHATEAASFGMNWMREMAEQNIGQTKGAVENFMAATHKVIEGVGYQGAVVQQQSLSLVEKTLSNALEFGQKMMQAREPQEFFRFQSEFTSKQAELLAEHTKKMNQTISQVTNDVVSAQKEARARSAAA
jgi:hypothetical protein